MPWGWGGWRVAGVADGGCKMESKAAGASPRPTGAAGSCNVSADARCADGAWYTPREISKCSRILLVKTSNLLHVFTRSASQRATGTFGSAQDDAGGRRAGVLLVGDADENSLRHLASSVPPPSMREARESAGKAGRRTMRMRVTRRDRRPRLSVFGKYRRASRLRAAYNTASPLGDGRGR